MAFAKLAECKKILITFNNISEVNMNIELRDYFAGLAMQGFLVGGRVSGEPEAYAKSAYDISDEMMKAREAKNKDFDDDIPF